MSSRCSISPPPWLLYGFEPREPGELDRPTYRLPLNTDTNTNTYTNTNTNFKKMLNGGEPGELDRPT